MTGINRFSLSALIGVFLAAPVFAAQKPTLLLLYPRLVDIAPSSSLQGAVSNSGAALVRILRKSETFSVFTIDDTKSAGPVTGGPNAEIEAGKKAGMDFVLSSRVYLFEDRLIVSARLSESAAGLVRFEDQVYTYNLSNASGMSNALEALAGRIAAYMKGEKIEMYSGELPPGEEVTIGTNGDEIVLPVKKSERLQKLTVAGIAYAFPTGFELEFLSGFYCWIHPDLRFGAGVGTELARIFLNYTNSAIMTGTILPIQIHFPIWTHPDAERVLDILFTAEWAWFSPLQISGSATNTNANTFFENPLRYLDFRVTGFFLPFASAAAGLQWLYESPQPRLNFYAGVSVFLGFYKKE